MHTNQTIANHISFDHQPVQLWIGNEQKILAHVEYLLQQHVCSNKGCTYCTECTKVRTKQHHAIVWIKPEKWYTKELLEPMMQAAHFSLPENSFFFFILQNTDFLTDTCANFLLKLLEEPPTGYRFLLLAKRKHMVLPTIRSRCIIQNDNDTDHEINTHPIFHHFAEIKPLTAMQFVQMLDTTDVNERESIELIDALFSYWRMQMHEKVELIPKIQKLIQAAEKPPMPGSSKLFWKQLFLQFYDPIKTLLNLQREYNNMF